MLRWRLILGFTISLAVVGLCLLDVLFERNTGVPGLALLPLLFLLIVLACREMLLLAKQNRVYPVPYITYLGCLVVGLSGWGTFVLQHYANKTDVQEIQRFEQESRSESSQGTLGNTLSEENRSDTTIAPSRASQLLTQLEHMTPGNWILSAFAFTLIMVFLQEMRAFVRPGAVNIRMAYTVFTIVYAGVLLTFIALIRLCFGLPDLIAFIAVVKMGDVGAYTIGRLFGRNKMAPGLSPGKTIEGAVGAILFACVTAWLVYGVVFPAVHGVSIPAPFNIWWLVYGIMLGFLGMLGDLAESLMKRDAEVKDAGDWVPGFGGVLDLLDSLLLSAPVAYAFLTLRLLS